MIFQALCPVLAETKMEEGPALGLTGHAPSGQDGPQVGDDGAEQMCYDGRMSNQGAGQGV